MAERKPKQDVLMKSKTRVQQHGEVFTPLFMVQKMLAEPAIHAAREDPAVRILEPARSHLRDFKERRVDFQAKAGRRRTAHAQNVPQKSSKNEKSAVTKEFFLRGYRFFHFFLMIW